MDHKQALELATKCHEGQKRWKGEDYITHPIAVVGLLSKHCHNPDTKIVAILHDVIEDSDMTRTELIKLGLKPELASCIQLLSHDKKQSYVDYILNVKSNYMATAVKIEDLNHNLSDLQNGSRKDKYLMALYILKRNY